MFSLQNFNLRIEEYQLVPEFHGREEILQGLFKYLTNELPCDLELVEAFAHKQNGKSQAILEHMGLKCVKIADGGYLHYQASYKDFLRWTQNIDF